MDAAQEVKSRLNIEDVISEYVLLKRTGRNFKGLSPWTHEKTPSFIVSPEKGIWHDFSSGKGGDVISFVMEMEGLDFRGALELLARKAGVDLEQFNQPAAKDARPKAYVLKALALGARFYQKHLLANQQALKYLLTDRGFSKQTLLDWQLGFSPNARNAMTEFLTKQGFDMHEIKLTGLIGERSGRSYDMFRGRIMIPLQDSRGQVIGFTARQLIEEPNSPKYINTPQTLVYDKSRHVFGLHLAKESIRKTGYVVVVEGNMDVIASHQAGVTNVVATAGTAITESHLRELKRFTGDIRLSFDADRAGLEATERAIPLAQKVGVDLSIITIKNAKDNDELIRKHGVKAWQQAIDDKLYAPDWVIERYAEQLDLETAQGKRLFADAVLAVVRRLGDAVEQDHYLQKIADMTDSTIEAVRKKFLNQGEVTTVGPRKNHKELAAMNRAEVEYLRLQDHFLAVMFFSPKLREQLNDVKLEYFSDEPQRMIYEFLLSHPDYKGGKRLPSVLMPVNDYVKILSLQFEELYQGLLAQDLAEQAAGLKQRLIEKYATSEKSRLAEQMQQTTDEAELHKLMKQVDALNKLIKH